jgi:hypothetical protein
MQNHIQTLQKQTSLFTEAQLMFLPEDSHASRTAWPESVKAKTMSATSGRTCLEQYQRFSPATLWAKTFPALLIGTEGWYSKRCKLTWKLKGTKSHRLYFQLAALTRPIEGTEYGLLPTPVVMDTNGGNLEKIDQRRARAKAKGINGNGFGVTLTELANRGMLPTPTARDLRSGFSQGSKAFEKRKLQSRGVNLHEHIQREIGQNFQLNPRFVMEMMGFPPDWTELPFLNGGTKV